MKKIIILIVLGVMIGVNSSCLPGGTTGTKPALTNAIIPAPLAIASTSTHANTPMAEVTLAPSATPPDTLTGQIAASPTVRLPATPPDTPTATAGVTIYINGYGGDAFTAKDNLLNSEFGNNNLGAHNNFELSRSQNSILEFDLSAIPSSATCLAATLYLYNSYGYGSGSPISTIYSLSEANAGWIEGTGNIDSALEGESNWNAFAADGNGGVKIGWAGSPGASTPETDYETAVIGSFAWNPADPLGTEYAIPLDTRRVQGWFGLNNTNYGIIILTAGGKGHVAQSDHFTPEYRPKLVIQYTLTP